MTTRTDGIALRSADPYLVAPHVLSAFAEAVGETDPLCHDAHAAAALGYSGVVAAPGFAFVVGYRLGAAMIDAAGIPLEKVLHVRESHQIVQPIIAGAELDVAATSAGPRVLSDGRQMLAWDVAITDASGGAVATTSTTVLVRPDGRWPERRPAGSPSDPELPAWPTTEQRRVTRGNVARYCGVSGDAHPVHWSDSEARRLGLPGVIMHGSLLFSIAAGAAARVCGGVTRIAAMSARFVVPVDVPDDGHGTVLEIGAKAASSSGSVLLSVCSAGQPVLGAVRAEAVMTERGENRCAVPDAS